MMMAIVMVMTLLPTSALAVGGDANAPITSVSVASDSLVQITKAVSENNGAYKLTLDTYATGTVSTTDPTPSDIVLVLDVSGSMGDNLSNTETKLDALKNAVNSFIDKTADQNAKITDDAKKNSISIVKFAGDQSNEIGNDTYETGFIYTQTNNYSQIVEGLTTVDPEGQTSLKDAVSKLTAAGATSADYGMALAQKALQNSTDRHKVVVFFTDGKPNHYSEFDVKVAAAAINSANTLKTDGAKIYTIGVMAGANPSDTDSDINQYMNAMSSNFPDASANQERWQWKITLGTRAADSYYKAASNADELTNIFGEISTEITSRVTADATSVLTDTISEYFVPSDIDADTNGTVSGGVKVFKVAASGTGAVPVWEETPKDITNDVTVTLNGKTIEVTGFDYSGTENLVVQKDGKWQGYKLQLEFNIAADKKCTKWKSGTWNYPTNVAEEKNAKNAGLAYGENGENGKTELTESPEVAVTAYSVTYDGNGSDGGNAVTDKKAYIPGATVTVQKNTFTKKGYQFTAWNTRADGEGIAYTEAFTMGNENVNLYAQWVKNENATKEASYSVEYYTDGEQVVGDTQTVKKDIWVGANTLTVDKEAINTTDKYAGYVFEKTDPETIPNTIEDKGVIKVYYAKDENNDQIPDKYQATVTFKVVHGSWNDGSTDDQKRTVTLYEKNATTGEWTLCSEDNRTINVPTGMKPATGYVENSGAWNDTAITDGKVVVAAAATYTYTFNAMNQYTVTVNYLIENTTTQLKPSYSTTVSHGDAYDVTAQVPATLTYGEKNDNYVKVSSDAETGNASGNVIINVYYALDNWKDADQTEDENDKDSLTGGDGIPDKYQALVKFESADAKKGTVAGEGAVQVFTFKDTDGKYLTSGNVTPSLDNVTTTPADGFVFDYWTKDNGTDSVDPATTMKNVPGGTTIIFKANWKSNVVTITFNANGGAWKEAVDGYTMGAENKTASKEFMPSDTVEKITHDPANGTKKFVGWGISAAATEPLSLLALSPQAAKLKELTEGTGTLYAIWEDAAQPTEKLNYTIHQHYIGSNGKQDAQFNDELPKTASAGTQISELIPAELQKDQKYYYQTYIYLSSETKIVNDNVATPVADDTVLNKNNTQIHLYYYLDAWNDKNDTLTGGDGIPDKYQAVVTYKVVGGTWKDGKTDAQVQVFTLKNKNADGAWVEVTPVPTLDNTIPTGMISSYSRTASQSWDKDITKDTKVTESVTHTYTFTKGSSGGGSSGGGGGRKPTVTIPDDVPTGLNGDDHFAYIVGYPDGNVKPGSSITRAEVATIFFRLLTEDVRTANSTQSNSLSDVSRGQWFNHAISTLSSMGIVKGNPDGTFDPDAPITRAEFAAIAARFDDKNTNNTSNFSDIASHWAKDEIGVAANKGWINGYPDSTFRPDQYITRAEAMTLVNRVLNRLPEKSEDLLDDMIKWPDNADASVWYYLAVQEATNSHDYSDKSDADKYEKWTKIRDARDWTELEK